MNPLKFKRFIKVAEIEIQIFKLNQVEYIEFYTFSFYDIFSIEFYL